MFKILQQDSKIKPTLLKDYWLNELESKKKITKHHQALSCCSWIKWSYCDRLYTQMGHKNRNGFQIRLIVLHCVVDNTEHPLHKARDQTTVHLQSEAASDNPINDHLI